MIGEKSWIYWEFICQDTILVYILNSQIPYIVPSTIDYKLRQHDERIVMIFGNIQTTAKL